MFPNKKKYGKKLNKAKKNIQELSDIIKRLKRRVMDFPEVTEKKLDGKMYSVK